ncbi:MAG: GNAT family N-acetyltransferase [Phycisphaerae bacterium]|nr:GNAT family N-acetyltransferase [Phycisphaerae bacterium]
MKQRIEARIAGSDAAPPVGTAVTLIRPAQSDEFREALRLSFVPANGDRTRAMALSETVLAHARAMQHDVSRQWVALRNGRLVTACTYLETPGRLATLMIPGRFVADAGPSAAGEMLNAAAGVAAQRGNRLIQCLLTLEDASEVRSVLAASGYVMLARLLHMERSIQGAPPEAAPAADGLRWRTFDSTTAPLFREVIHSSYEGSLDCPKLSSVRSVDDAIESHRSAGYFKPHRWLLIEVEGQPAACALFNETPLRAGLELVYMGVAPLFRGRGLGARVLARGLALAHREGFSVVDVAVDESNRPAIDLYCRLGFRAGVLREAWARILSDHAEG